MPTLTMQHEPSTNTEIQTFLLGYMSAEQLQEILDMRTASTDLMKTFLTSNPRNYGLLTEQGQIAESAKYIKNTISDSISDDYEKTLFRDKFGTFFARDDHDETT